MPDKNRERPKISVIVPIFGVEKYIERCARSLFEQTLMDIEFIFIDDCTLDNSMAILNRVIDEYRPRFAGMSWTVRTERMLANSGQAAVRKHGIQLCRGEYVIHCDSDDWVDANMYEVMYEAAVREDADMVVCDYYISDGVTQERRIGCHTNTVREYFENLLYQKDNWVLWNKMFRRSVYTNDFIYPKYAMGEDCVFCLQLVWNSKNITYVDKPYYYYYNNGMSITRDNSEENVLRKFQQSVANAEDIFAFMKRSNLYDKYSDAVDSIFFNKKNILLPLISSNEYFQLWKKTFPELNYRIFLNKRVPLRRKFNHMMALLPLRKYYYHYGK